MEDKAERERILTSTPKDRTSPAISVDKHERKTLQTLQLSATGNKLNGGKNQLLLLKDNVENEPQKTRDESYMIKPTHSSSQIIKVYEDSSVSEHTSIAHCCRLVQTDDSLLEELLQDRLKQATYLDDSGGESGYIDQEAYDLMVKDEVSETYWKDFAEVRRRALQEALAENERLCSEVEHLKDENKKLVEKNICLSNIAGKAEALQNLLESILSDDANASLEGDLDSATNCDPDTEQVPS